MQSWYRGRPSPFYRASHAELRAAVRKFVEEEVEPHCAEWDAAKRIPITTFRAAARCGLLAAVTGAPWPVGLAPGSPPGGIAQGDFDAFHELVALDEACRCGSGGTVWGLLEGIAIGLPPVLHFGSEALRQRVAPPCLAGEKVICLCISEPYAGSDVAALRCSAKLDPSGQHYIVNGEKKWITNGTYADYFTVAVRTGGPGARGISMLLLERGMPGIETRQMDCQGVWASGTAFVTFTDVKVPVGNLIGPEGAGFKQIMYNFNHERWGFVVQANRFARVCLEDAVQYAERRRTFGKTLMEHPVIRWKVAEMARQIEATHSALELLTYQMSRMSKEEQNAELGADCALLKVQATKTFEYCAREAAQIMGGVSYVRGGQGEKVERLYREVRAYAIPGGSEEVLLDFAVRQASRDSAKARARM